MFTLSRILGLAAAGAFVAFTAASIPARGDESAKSLEPAGPHAPILTECHMLRRAISRHACQARLWRIEQIKTAQKK
jgi:hypothetical protein